MIAAACSFARSLRDHSSLCEATRPLPLHARASAARPGDRACDHTRFCIAIVWHDRPNLGRLPPCHIGHINVAICTTWHALTSAQHACCASHCSMGAIVSHLYQRWTRQKVLQLCITETACMLVVPYSTTEFLHFITSPSSHKFLAASLHRK